MTNQTEQERAAFESYILQERGQESLLTFAGDDNCQEYVNDYVQEAWESWQAGRASMQSAPQEPTKAALQPSTNLEGVYPEWVVGPSLFKDWCGQFFGPDADETYLAKAVKALPMINAAPTKEQKE